METEHRRREKSVVANTDPFAQTLNTLVQESCFNSQTALAKAIGLNSGRSVSNWCQGVNVPAAEHMSRLLRTLRLDQSQIDDLVDKWGVHLQEGKGYRGRQAGTQRDLRRSQSRRETDTELPISEWILEITQTRGLTLKDFAKTLGLRASTLNSSRKRGFTKKTRASILKRVALLDLTPEEQIKLTDAFSYSV